MDVLMEAATELRRLDWSSKPARLQMEDSKLKELVWTEHQRARKEFGIKGLPFFVMSLKAVKGSSDEGTPRSFKHDEPTAGRWPASMSCSPNTRAMVSSKTVTACCTPAMAMKTNWPMAVELYDAMCYMEQELA